MTNYVPRVLICGDIDEFKKIVGDKPIEIVGQVSFEEAASFKSEAEYLIFTDALEHREYLEKIPWNSQVMTASAFVKKIRDGFFSIKIFALLIDVLNHKRFNRVLDLDGYFAKSDFNTRGELNVAVDGIGDKLYPIMENVYNKIYKTFDDCKFHTFDAILLGKERSPEEFIDIVIKTNDLTDKILMFVRKNSSFESWLQSNRNIFERIEYFKSEKGAWCSIKKVVPPANVGIYIVTHKDVKLSEIPMGYKIIHAGHIRAEKDFGYLGDDIGDNISRLNPFLDEVTALYWMWKNTSHTHTGFVHYRRFLTSNTNQELYRPGEYIFNVENVLSETDILKILSEYDIIVNEERTCDRTQLEMMIYSTQQPDLVRFSERVVRKHLIRKQPDYLDAYDAVINSFVFFLYGIHVTRRNIFEAYCKWLFSFIIDATEELAARVTFNNKKLEELPHVYSRMMSFFAERMLTVWLKKNHLKIKSLPIMYRDDV